MPARSSARQNAEALAAAAGERLGSVKSISYNHGGSRYAFRVCESGGHAPGAAPDDFPEVDFEPEPIDIECEVDVVWWLREPEK